jgi:hypothetical protein
MYVLNFDGSMFNEICEFTFWNNKFGNGYYFQAGKDSEQLHYSAQQNRGNQ